MVVGRSAHSCVQRGHCVAQIGPHSDRRSPPKRRRSARWQQGPPWLDSRERDASQVPFWLSSERLRSLPKLSNLMLAGVLSSRCPCVRAADGPGNAPAAVCGPCELMTIAALYSLGRDLTRNLSLLAGGGRLLITATRRLSLRRGARRFLERRVNIHTPYRGPRELFANAKWRPGLSAGSATQKRTSP
jgi:hypothetical protein